MPTKYLGGAIVVRHWCQRKIAWSYSRGGCRLAPNHAGPCKPGRYRR